jgi:crossover junction endodeoxyribonuclease RuvC
MKICGVDPGLAGAAAIIAANDGAMPELIDAIDLPLAGVAAKTRIDMLALRAWIETHKPDCAVIERAGSMPRQGVASTFKFGRATSAIEATVALCGVPMSVVEASVWKRRFGLYGTEKEASRLLAIQKISCLARAVQSAATPQSRRSGADRARNRFTEYPRARGKSAVGGADLSDIHSQIGEHHDTTA